MRMLISCENVQTHRCIIPRVDPTVNCGPWVIMMWQCWFIICNKYTTLVGLADNRSGVHMLETEAEGEISSSAKDVCDQTTPKQGCIIKN